MSTGFIRMRPIRLVRIDLLLILSVAMVCTAYALPTEIRSAGLAIIDMVYREEFRTAEDEAKKMIRERGDHPAGYFFLAVVLDSWMAHYQSNDREDDFYKYCEMAISKAESYLARYPNDPWAGFFLGGADGFIGTYEARNGKWITAFRHGWKGVSRLMQISEKHPEIRDVNYGVGTYEYWRSAMTKTLWFMPGVEDKRESGIRKLHDARTNGLFTKTASALALLSVLVNEKRYDEALMVADDVLKRYPTCTVVHIARADIQVKRGALAEAEKAYRFILSRLDADPKDTFINRIQSHRALMQLYFDQGRHELCLAEYTKMNQYRLPGPVRKRLEKDFSVAEDLKKRSEAIQLRSSESQTLSR